MNIFFTHNIPSSAAEYLFTYDKRRANKMLIESIQILSTVHKDNPFPKMKPTHENHPVVKAVREDIKLARWLGWYVARLQELYFLCRGKPHATEATYHDFIYSIVGLDYNVDNPLNFACSKSKNLDFRHIPDVCLAYRLYLGAQGVGEQQYIEQGQKMALEQLIRMEVENEND